MLHEPNPKAFPNLVHQNRYKAKCHVFVTPLLCCMPRVSIKEIGGRRSLRTQLLGLVVGIALCTIAIRSVIPGVCAAGVRRIASACLG
jgi:hypothetical protein